MKTILMMMAIVAITVALHVDGIAQQFIQQGPKLVGIGTFGSNNEQGWSVSISTDGNTAIVGGPADSTTGAVWVFIRSGGVWTQQGPKLVGTGAVGAPYQGWSVAISADGNTFIVGGWGDNTYVGAAWIFTRSGGVWTQQGSKLVGTGAVGQAQMGTSVAISPDGNTAIVGGPEDNSLVGAVWIFTRSGGVWTQQGAKIVGTSAVGNAYQGNSVALSSDGNTAIEGGPIDNGYSGAVWVFTRSGGVWTQQGAKLAGAGEIGTGNVGISVAISADGNTAITGGWRENNLSGAAWVFTRSGGVWSQQGPKIVGTGAVGNAYQGSSVAISADGNTAIVNGRHDHFDKGAFWAFTRSGGTWTQLGQKLLGTGGVGSSLQGYSVAVSSEGTVIEGGPADSTVGAVWIFVNQVSGVRSISGEVPEAFSLSQNYPNPFNPSTAINYQIPVTSQVMLKVFDVLGNEIATLVNEEKPAGSYEVDFDANRLPSGVYFYKLQAGVFVGTKKMILIK